MLFAIQWRGCLRFASKWLSDARDCGPKPDALWLMCHCLEEQGMVGWSHTCVRITTIILWPICGVMLYRAGSWGNWLLLFRPCLLWNTVWECSWSGLGWEGIQLSDGSHHQPLRWLSGGAWGPEAKTFRIFVSHIWHGRELIQLCGHEANRWGPFMGIPTILRPGSFTFQPSDASCLCFL